MFRKSIFELKRAAKRVQAMRGNENDIDTFTRDLGDIHKEIDKVRDHQKILLKELGAQYSAIPVVHKKRSSTNRSNSPKGSGTHKRNGSQPG